MKHLDFAPKRFHSSFFGEICQWCRVIQVAEKQILLAGNRINVIKKYSNVILRAQTILTLESVYITLQFKHEMFWPLLSMLFIRS